MKKNAEKHNLFLFSLETLISLYRTRLHKGGIRRRYGNKRLLSHEETDEYIKKMIYSGQPFFVGRLGSYELRCVNRYVMKKLRLHKAYNEWQKCSFVLFRNNETLVDCFCEATIKALNEFDLHATWIEFGEAYLIRHYKNRSKLCWLGDIEPYFSNNPWSEALMGKKILVISPFAREIENQYAKRSMLFQNVNVLPEFTLMTVSAVMILDNNDYTFRTWKDALEYTYTEAMKNDFDIAIIGCGPIGIPLGAKLKQTGKSVIYLGGSTQILFGIKGKRWDNQSAFREMYNEHWIYPYEELVKGKETLDEGCYWQ